MNRDNILSCFLGGVVGDAMGAATEVRTMEQIEEQFGGYAKEFSTPPGDTFAHSYKRGQTMDDFDIACMNCVEIANNHGIIDEEAVKKALLKWYEVSEFKWSTESTAKTAMQALTGETSVDTRQETFIPAVGSGKETNGVVMEAAPIALFGRDDIELAVRNMIKLRRMTHNNNIALPGACVTTTATTQAPHEGTALDEIIDAGVYEAAQGDQLDRTSGKTTCGPPIEKRIKKAVELDILTKDMEEALMLIEDYIGNGLTAAEAMPAVFGLIAASKGDLLEVLFTGMNIGDDADTVAMMIDGIMGVYRGASSSLDEYLTAIKENNRIDIEGLAEQIGELWKGEQEHI